MANMKFILKYDTHTSLGYTIDLFSCEKDWFLSSYEEFKGG
jgi:hypothetical protein